MGPWLHREHLHHRLVSGCSFQQMGSLERVFSLPFAVDTISTWPNCQFQTLWEKVAGIHSEKHQSIKLIWMDDKTKILMRLKWEFRSLWIFKSEDGLPFLESFSFVCLYSANASSEQISLPIVDHSSSTVPTLQRYPRGRYFKSSSSRKWLATLHGKHTLFTQVGTTLFYFPSGSLIFLAE